MDEATLDEEVNNYQREDAIGKSRYPLTWWRKNMARFPLLSVMTKALLAIFDTSMNSE